MELKRPPELREIQADDREARKFIVEVSLKLRRKKSSQNDESLSLFEMVTDQ